MVEEEYKVRDEKTMSYHKAKVNARKLSLDGNVYHVVGTVKGYAIRLTTEPVVERWEHILAKYWKGARIS